MYSGLAFVKEMMTQYNRSNKNRKRDLLTMALYYLFAKV